MDILGAAGRAAPWQRVPAMGAVTGDEAVGEAAGDEAVRDGAARGVPARDGPTGDRWYCGPGAHRRAYVVDDIGAVVEGGQGHVVRAERRTFAGDPVGYAGPVSLKLMTERRPERVAVVRDRWSRLAAIDHPNLVQALEVFEGPGLFRTTCPPVTDDVLYVAASWVEGRSLRALAPVDPPTAAAVARDLAAALAALHDHGLVHRDVHPGNVVIGDDGRATLIDLGSARPDDGGATATVAGALGFIPPETLHGPGGAAADRWGLGMVTVFALLGHPQGAAGRAALEAELAGVLAGTGDRRRLVGLLAAMVDPDPSRRPADPVGWARELSDALQARPARRARRRLALAAGAAALTLVAAAGTVVLGGDRGEAPPAGSAATSEASASPASPDPAAAPDCTPVAAGGASPEMAAAVDRLVPGACAEGVPHGFVDAEVQPVADADGEPLGVVVLPPEGDAVLLNETMWASYREIAGKVSPENAVLFGGYPAEVEQRSDPGAVIVHLDRGGYMVGRRDDTQLFWLPVHVRDLHEAHGGLAGDLGFPTSNPYFVGGTLRLDFEHGYMSAPLADFADLVGGEEVDTAVLVDDRSSALPEVPIRERILRQASGTAWWVDAAGTRHWIPDGGTWQCLGGDAVVAADALPGWAVATLPLGPPATCPGAPD